MKTITYSDQIDRSEWPEGPWDSEPEDKVQFQDEKTGYPCLMVRNKLGNWCGYVGVNEGHPAFERKLDDWGAPETLSVEVHGGVTFSGHCDTDAPEGHGICHVPEPGEPDDIWWLGWDAAHSGDLVPGMLAFQPDFRDQEVYRNMAYVKEQCASLAKQLKAMETMIGELPPKPTTCEECGGPLDKKDQRCPHWMDHFRDFANKTIPEVKADTENP